MVELERERVSNLAELPEAVRFIFETPAPTVSMLPWKGTDTAIAKARLQAVRDLLEKEDFSDSDGLEDRVKRWIAERGWGNGEVLWPLRVALTGREKSPGPFQVAVALGKEETLDRITHAIHTLG